MHSGTSQKPKLFAPTFTQHQGCLSSSGLRQKLWSPSPFNVNVSNYWHVLPLITNFKCINITRSSFLPVSLIWLFMHCLCSNKFDFFLLKLFSHIAIVKQYPGVDFRSTQKNETDNPMNIHVSYRFKLFLIFKQNSFSMSNMVVC